MWKKLVRLVRGEDCDLRERMLRTIVLVGGLAAVVGIVEIFAVMHAAKGILPFIIMMLITMIVCLFAAFKYHKYDLAAGLLGIVIILIVFPELFYAKGGAVSGASIWLTLGIMYIFVMFSGKKLWFYLAICLLSYAATYIVAYVFPETVAIMPSRKAIYIDSYFSLVVAGLVGGIILKLHLLAFEEEHKLNISQKEEIEQTSNAKNIFFANMSHEIRTPINTIIGLNEMILRSDADAQTKECAQDIQLASTMLLNQVNDILDLSQMEMKMMRILPLEYKTVDLFGDLVEMIRVRMEKKKLMLYLDIDKNLPSSLLGDEKRLKQIFLNILDNAVKYTEEGSVTLTVHGERCSGNEVMLKVMVADTGIGIRKEDVGHIYDYFNRADESAHRRIGGSGLGLAITKHLVDLIDGEITVDSIYTKGSTFTVRFKQEIVDKTPIGEVNLFNRKVLDGGQYKPLFEAPEARVLVVDDNTMNSLLLERLLQGTKVQVDIANSGSKCLEMTKKKYYNVILMDYLMPGMSGVETLKELRVQENGLCREAPVIVVTANAMVEAREEFYKHGFDGYVEKPIKGKVLEAEVLKFLPEELVEYREPEYTETEELGRLQERSGKKRKKIYITTDCTCDLPTELIDKYDIRLMYLYVKTPHGRFADTKEIDSDSLGQYISSVSSEAYADGVTIEEYEDFFAETLTQAESVIHISLSANAGVSYNTATRAAEGFDHVRIVDSGQISCGQGLIALYAARLASEGKSADEIIASVEKIKKQIQTRFVMPGAGIFSRGGRMRSIVAKLCDAVKLHPMVRMKQGRAVCVGLLGGSVEHAWRLGIRWHLRDKRKISKEVVFITHVGCSVKQQELIKSEVLKCIPFDRVIMQKASFTSGCNSGIESIGISYYSTK